MSKQQGLIISCSILVIGIVGCFFLDMYIDRCRGPCGRLRIKTAHEGECRAGHTYYTCQLDQVLRHANCTPWDDPDPADYE